jgi:hypothetical protein
MKTSNRMWRGIACGGLSLALLGGVGLPITALAASNGNSVKTNPMQEHRHEMRAMREKMLAEAKAEDATLEKMVAELHKAPEAKKVDLEAAILTKLVAQHHRMLGDWESMHAQMMQFRRERMSGSGMMHGMHGMMGQSVATAKK